MTWVCPGLTCWAWLLPLAHLPLSPLGPISLLRPHLGLSKAYIVKMTVSGLLNIVGKHKDVSLQIQIQ